MVLHLQKLHRNTTISKGSSSAPHQGRYITKTESAKREEITLASKEKKLPVRAVKIIIKAEMEASHPLQRSSVE